jgi:hypothetical protein
MEDHIWSTSGDALIMAFHKMYGFWGLPNPFKTPTSLGAYGRILQIAIEIYASIFCIKMIHNM